MVRVERFWHQPLLHADMDASLEGNVNGPSLIRLPDWVSGRLGDYYLYFAHHAGRSIRLAYADRLEGPWRIYRPGVLQLESSYCRGHIASPDVHLDPVNRRIVLFYHGPPDQSDAGRQRTFAAVSASGLDFHAAPKAYGNAYWRGFQWSGHYYAVTMSGKLYRGNSLLGDYEEGPNLFRELAVKQRHMAVKVVGDRLYLFYSLKEDRPEHIVVSKLRLTEDWRGWRVDSHSSVLLPEFEYEGADRPLEASKSGVVYERVRQLRDPCIYEEADQTYLLYSIAGESGIAMVKLSKFQGGGAQS